MLIQIVYQIVKCFNELLEDLIEKNDDIIINNKMEKSIKPFKRNKFDGIPLFLVRLGKR